MWTLFGILKMGTLFGIFFICSSLAAEDSIYLDLVRVCYDDIGCFWNTGPFTNALSLLPESPTDIDVKYQLFTRLNSDSPQFLTTNVDSVRSSNFSESKDTKFIIHGLKQSVSDEYIKMKDEILTREDVNVILVDWFKGADKINYARAVANARVVGALISLLMKTLDTVANGNYFGRMHLIGHSLGAHVAGYAGERIPGTGRITGLDPAGPLFKDRDPVVRLDPTDASFVDVIHTTKGFGIKSPVGHVDFYVNGGKTQPGCPKGNYLELIKLLVKGEFTQLADSVFCSHRRSVYLFIESINSDCPFKAFPCKTCGTCGQGCAIMGYYASEGNPRGVYYLSTNSEQPFCIADSMNAQGVAE